jgi:hypothetical protein
MILRTILIFVLTSTIIMMATTKPTITLDISYEQFAAITATDLPYKKETLKKVKKEIVDKVNALPDKDSFMKEVEAIAEDLGISPAQMLIKFYIESKINPNAKNPVSSASGIYQAMQMTLPKGMTTEQFRKLSATEQLKYYRGYISNYAKYIRPGHVEDLYVANICPRALIKNQEVLYSSPSKEYKQNKVLDVNKDGKITRTDIRKIILSWLNE